MNGPFLPICVSLLQKGKGEKSLENGSEHFPFSSLKQAKEAYCKIRTSSKEAKELEANHLPVIKLTCGEDCHAKECFYRGCTTLLCHEHGGHGLGFWHASEEDILFYRFTYSCQQVACHEHHEPLF